MIIDTHTHLNTAEFDKDLDDVLGRARANNVQKIIVIGMDQASSAYAIKLSDTHDMLYATAGIHPGYVDQESDTTFIEAMIRENRVVAIGECGLDFYWNRDNIALQKEVFRKQIELAVSSGLPLVIHTRSSFDEAYDMLLPYRGKVKGVFHCFSSHLTDAQRAIELGFHIGIDGPITFKKNHDLTEIVKTIDLSNILIETDSPYLAPVPHRGQRNEPGYIHHVVQKIATIRGISASTVQTITTQNAHALFKLGG